MSEFSEQLPRRLFLLCAAAVVLSGAFFYGALAQRANLPPIPWIKKVYFDVKEVLSPSDQVLETTGTVNERAASTLIPGALQDGLVLVSGDVEKRKTMVRVMDRDGRVIHEWRAFWSDIWGDDEGDFPERPRTGVYLHGVELLPDGSLVANFEHQSTFRLDICGDVMWKLDNLGHHSVHYADDETLWVSGEDRDAGLNSGFPNHDDPIRSWTLDNIDLDGKVLRSIPVIEVLLKNGLEGLLYLSSLRNGAPRVRGDTLHLNDVETFPAEFESEMFNPGDLLISLRNINAVMVLDPDTLEVKFLSIGGFVRQHDPDFLPGDKISVFDNFNHTMAPEFDQPYSRIVEIDARNGEMTSILDDESESLFFTEIMGQHQRLENGNILVVSSGEGRVLEYTADGRLAWRYENTIRGEKMRIYGSKVLPPAFDEAFFKQRAASCNNPVQS